MNHRVIHFILVFASVMLMGCNHIFDTDSEEGAGDGLVNDTHMNAGNDAHMNTGNGTHGTGDTPPAYDWIPKGAALTDRMAIRFLNMATFGATPQAVQDLRAKGVVKWVDEQLAAKWDPDRESVLRHMMYQAIRLQPYRYFRRYKDLSIPKTEAEVHAAVRRFLEDNDYVFNRSEGNGPSELDYHSSNLVAGQIQDPQQLRQRTAYALSQIIIASQSNDDFFRDRGEALSYYYDLLLAHAFDRYGDLLYDVSLSPAMATYLTYASNQKAHKDSSGTWVTPDENYGREVMQLFSIGLYALNMDGTEKRQDGDRIPVYTQEDVNAMSRVFTGLVYAHGVRPESFMRGIKDGDMIHPLICMNRYHDTDQKHVLGADLPAGQDCYEDVKSAVNLLTNHPNAAPFIAKKLILRLTKSNPNTDYVQRVAEVFKNTHGNLGQTVKAILLDQELWADIKNGTATKLKEPYVAFVNLLRALDVQPFKHYSREDGDAPGDPKPEYTIKNHFFIPSHYSRFGEWPTWSPTVFNFYSDRYEPDDNLFKIRGFVSPESQIMTTKYLIAMLNYTYTILSRGEKNYLINVNGSEEGIYTKRKLYKEPNYMLIDLSELIEMFRPAGSTQVRDMVKEDEAFRTRALGKVLDWVEARLIGEKMDKAFRDTLIEKYQNKFKGGNDPEKAFRANLVSRVIAPVISEIVASKYFMVQ